MNSRPVALVIIAVSCHWLAGCSSQAVGASSPAANQSAAPKHDFPVLEKGMTTGVIRQKLGDPAEIKPMDAPGGKAEIWVYHIENTVGVTQVASGTRDVPAFSMGLSGPITIMVPEPVYTMVEKTSMVTLSLLVFNDRLAAQRIQVENHTDYK
jgi:hypothetical protein